MSNNRVNFDISLDDVRNYLNEHDAVLEAENFFNSKQDVKLEGVDNKEREIDRQKVENVDIKMRERSVNNKAQQREDILTTLINQKHTGAISLQREEVEMRRLQELDKQLRDENMLMENERRRVATELRLAKKEQIESLEREAEQDLINLEEQRAMIEKDMSSKRTDVADLRNVLLGAEKEMESITTKRNAERVISQQTHENTIDERKRKQTELNERHTKQVVENQISAFATKLENAEIEKGNYSFKAQLSGEPSSGVEDIKIVKRDKEEMDRMLNNDSSFRKQQQRLDKLRREAEEEEELLGLAATQSDYKGGQDVQGSKQGVEDIREHLNQPWLGAKRESEASIEGHVDGKVISGMQDYLEMWLQGKAKSPRDVFNGSIAVKQLSGPNAVIDADNNVNMKHKKYEGENGKPKSRSRSANNTPGVSNRPSRIQSSGLESIGSPKVPSSFNSGNNGINFGRLRRAPNNNNNQNPELRQGQHMKRDERFQSSYGQQPLPGNAPNGYHQHPSQQPYNPYPQQVQPSHGYQPPYHDNYGQQYPPQMNQPMNPYQQQPYQPPYQQQPFQLPYYPQHMQQAPQMQQPYQQSPYQQQPPQHVYQPPQQQQQQGDLISQMNAYAAQLESENAQLLPPQKMEQKDDVAEAATGNSSGHFRRADSSVPNKPVESNHRPSRQELKHRMEMETVVFEMELLKKQQELQDYKDDLAKSKAMRSQEEEQEKVMLTQANELQRLKMQQAIVKEQRLLELQGGVAQAKPLDEATSEVQKTGDGGAPSSNFVELLREESAVSQRPLDMNVVSGLAVFTDGIILDEAAVPAAERGDVFRVAIGICDDRGLFKARLQASEWQSWQRSGGGSVVNNNSNSAAALPVSDDGSQDYSQASLHPLSSTIKRAVKKLEPDHHRVDCLRCVVELQVKSSSNPKQKSIGWVVLGLVTGSDEGGPCLANGLWRISLRKGVSEATCDLSSPPLLGVKCCVLLRVVDNTNVTKASGWHLNNSEIADTPQALMCYREVLRPPTVVKPEPSVMKPEKPPKVPSRIPSRQSTPGRTVPTLRAPSRTATPTSRPPSGSGGSPSIVRQLSSLNLIKPIAEEVKDPLDADDYSDTDSDAEDGFASTGASGDVDPATMPWQRGLATKPCNEKFQRGDGVDIYIDAARFLPDNCTITRCVLKIYSSDSDVIGTQYVVNADKLSSCVSPSFAFKVEYRGPALNITSTAVFRFDTLECVTLESRCIGYSCIKIFSTKDREQPKANETNVYINTGLFQLPIRFGRLSKQEYFDDTALHTFPVIPCASALVRIYAAPKSSGGFSVLSREDFPKEDWEKMGLDYPVSPYASGLYDGVLCEPIAGLHTVSFDAKATNPLQTIDTALTLALDSYKNRGGTKEFNQPMNDESRQEWMNTLIADKVGTMLDCTFVSPYSADLGVAVSVEGLVNMADSIGVFNSTVNLYKVISSIVPPAVYYMDPPLSEGVVFTRNHALNQAIKAPRFTDGFCTYNPPQLSQQQWLILDIRAIRVNPPKVKTAEAALTVEPAGAQTSYWTIMPILKERGSQQGFKYLECGSFALPLIEGAVPVDILSQKDPMKEVQHRLSLKDKDANSLKLSVDGATLLLRIYNPQLKSLFSSLLEERGESRNLMSWEESTVVSRLHASALIQAAANGENSSSSQIKMDKFNWSEAMSKYDGVVSNNSRKSLSQQLESVAKASDAKAVLKALNKQFADATALIY